MSPTGPKGFRLLAGAVACLLALTGRAGIDDAPGRAGSDSNQAAFRRLGSSPVEAFRKLLAMSPSERDSFLTNYPPATRERILDKMQQYQMLPPDFRELRLRVTELRWYLLPLLKTPPEQRAEKLRWVPEPYRDLVRARLEEWEMWPPDLRDEVLEYQSTFSCFVGRDAAGNAVIQQQMAAADLSEGDRPEVERKLAEWQAMSQAQRQQLFGCFQHYFELSDQEKEKTLGALAQPERGETAKVLGSIEKGSKAQQQAYLAAFRQFAEMSAADRQQFMKNAERWQKMSAEERQAWRDLVQQLESSPPLPPLPPGFIRPLPQPVGSGLFSAPDTHPAAAPPK